MLKLNDRFEILTDHGWCDFDGVNAKVVDSLFEVMTSNGIMFRSTASHLVRTTSGFKNVSALKPKSRLITGATIVYVKLILSEDVVYDPINVANISNSYIADDVVHHNCSFVGSSYTLVSGEKLSTLPTSKGTPLLKNNTLLQYAKPEEKHSYVMCVDTARGKGLDYSTFQIIDITSLPYKIVCTYRDNSISTMVYPEVIMKMANIYNDAFVLIETNDLGQQVADILFYDLEYENVYMSTSDDIKEGGAKASPGCRTTKRSKSIGCDALKDLIENDQLVINDGETINEFTTFVRVGTTYKAEEGKHDDLVMCLVMFAYLTRQPVFKDLFDFSLREQLFSSQLAAIDEQMLPLGFFDRGDVIQEPTSHRPGGWQENTTDVFNF